LKAIISSAIEVYKCVI